MHSQGTSNARTTLRAAAVFLLTCTAGLPLLSGCSAPSQSTAATDAPHVLPADLDLISGQPWTGALTYLDYTSSKPTTIPCTMIIARIPDPDLAWEMRIGYPDEPHANSSNVLRIGAAGTTLDNETVLERTTMRDGAIRLVTKTTGTDADRKATFKFIYVLSPNSCSIQKLVCPEGESVFFERHIYRWVR